MYSLARFDTAFNGTLPPGQKLWGDIVPAFAALNRRRFTRHSTQDLAALNGKPLEKAKREIIAAVKENIGVIVQFRHDWIHTCSRPKNAVKNYQRVPARTAVVNVESFVNVFEAHIEAHRLA